MENRTNRNKKCLRENETLEKRACVRVRSSPSIWFMRGGNTMVYGNRSVDVQLERNKNVKMTKSSGLHAEMP